MQPALIEFDHVSVMRGETLALNDVSLRIGAGEAAAAPVAAALANAVFDATGVLLTTVPFTAARVKTALAAKA